MFASFVALYQGDHLGVKFACDAHAKMLEEAGCHPAHNPLSANQLILHNKPISGLVTNDLFVLSKEDRAGAIGDAFLASSASSQTLDLAK